MKIKRNILLNPGPVTTTDSVKAALVVPDICPREKEFTFVMDQVRRDLIKVVHGGEAYTCVLFGGSGTAGMDMCLSSVVPPHGKIAIINNGAYGQRFIDIAKAYRIKTVEIKFSWDEVADPKKIEKVISADRSIKFFAFVHHETTSGLLNPLKEICKVAKKYNCVVIVDAISSYAGIPIDVKKNKIDFLISTSNKCIQGMPGIAFVVCKKQSLRNISDYSRRSFYLSLYDQYESFEKTGQSWFTPPVQVLYALRQALKEYFMEGERRRYERLTENWRILRRGLKDLGFEFLLEEGEESHILMTILEPGHPKFNFDKLHDLLYKNGITIYPGKINKLQAFRLANIGDLKKSDMHKVIHETKLALSQMGVNLQSKR